MFPLVHDAGLFEIDAVSHRIVYFLYLYPGTVEMIGLYPAASTMLYQMERSMFGVPFLEVFQRLMCSTSIRVPQLVP